VSNIFRRARLGSFFFVDNIYWPLAISPICKVIFARKKPIKQKNIRHKSYPIQGRAIWCFFSSRCGQYCGSLEWLGGLCTPHVVAVPWGPTPKVPDEAGRNSLLRLVSVKTRPLGQLPVGWEERDLGLAVLSACSQ